jgi:hypothetical protein
MQGVDTSFVPASKSKTIDKFHDCDIKPLSLVGTIGTTKLLNSIQNIGYKVTISTQNSLAII